jgi:hypothetical protein
MSDPTEPERKGFFRDFVSDWGWTDWLEFALYAVLAVGAVGSGIAWLAGRF